MQREEAEEVLPWSVDDVEGEIDEDIIEALFAIEKLWRRYGRKLIAS